MWKRHWVIHRVQIIPIVPFVAHLFSFIDIYRYSTWIYLTSFWFPKFISFCFKNIAFLISINPSSIEKSLAKCRGNLERQWARLEVENVLLTQLGIIYYLLSLILFTYFLNLYIRGIQHARFHFIFRSVSRGRSSLTRFRYLTRSQR